MIQIHNIIKNEKNNNTKLLKTSNDWHPKKKIIIKTKEKLTSNEKSYQK